MTTYDLPVYFGQTTIHYGIGPATVLNYGFIYRKKGEGQSKFNMYI